MELFRGYEKVQLEVTLEKKPTVQAPPPSSDVQ